jgi:hypothetical protein
MLTPLYWAGIPLIAGLLRAIFRSIEARYNEIRLQLTAWAAPYGFPHGLYE